MFNRKILMIVAGIIAFGAIAFAVTTIRPLVKSGNVTADRSQRIVGNLSAVTTEAAVTVFPNDTESPSAKVTVCDGRWQGDAHTSLNGWYTGQEFYAVYQDPTEVGCPGGITYPFQVQNVIWHVFNATGADFDIDLQPVIYAVDDTDPLCPRPGDVCCVGPIYTVTVPVGTSGAIITLPLDSGCCVKGPYFAGVWGPEFIGSGILGVVIDSAGVPGSFGNRTCANYNNYRGFWEDLIVDYVFPGNVLLWSDGTASDMNSCDPCAQIIEAGPDLWVTPPGSFDNHFGAQPIPADFFDPGSDPFIGNIPLQGDPLQTDPPGILGPTDAIVERQGECILPAPGATDVVDIQIVALDLVSTQPIIVTFNGGQNPEQWDVRVVLSSAQPQQQGSMTLTKDCCNGGTFVSTLPVIPKFIFTRPSDNMVRELDLGALSFPPIQFQTQNGYWSYDIPEPFHLIRCPGLVFVDHDLSPSTPDVFIPPSSKFTPGFRTVPCNPSSPDEPYCGGKVLTREQEMLAEHGVLPPQADGPIEGACCLPDGSCIYTTIECCEELALGTYQGDFIACSPELCPTIPDTLFDTLCVEVTIDLTGLIISDPDCFFPPMGTITLGNDPSIPTVVRRTPGPPYSAGETIQTEIIQMELTGTSPDLGAVRLTTFPSPGTISVTTADGSGNLTNGAHDIDLFIDEIQFTDVGRTVSPFTSGALPLHATLVALPPSPGSIYAKTGAPYSMLWTPGGNIGAICDFNMTILDCNGCCVGIRGDANGDGSATPNILDLNWLVNYIFRLSGDPGPCPEESDANGDGSTTPNILDLNWIVNYIFRLGPPPPPCP